MWVIEIDISVTVSSQMPEIYNECTSRSFKGRQRNLRQVRRITQLAYFVVLVGPPKLKK